MLYLDVCNGQSTKSWLLFLLIFQRFLRFYTLAKTNLYPLHPDSPKHASSDGGPKSPVGVTSGMPGHLILCGPMMHWRHIQCVRLYVWGQMGYAGSHLSHRIDGIQLLGDPEWNEAALENGKMIQLSLCQFISTVIGIMLEWCQ